jgi:hypothetical protein
MPESVTNETLASILRGQEKRGDERHTENVRRLDEIRDEVKATNGRLQKVEKRQAVDLNRFGQISSALERKADASEIERLEDALKRKADRGERALKPRREVVIKVGLAGAGGAGLLLLQLLWKAFHG